MSCTKQVKIAFFFRVADKPLGGGWEASLPYEKSRAYEVRDSYWKMESCVFSLLREALR